MHILGYTSIFPACPNLLHWERLFQSGSRTLSGLRGSCATNATFLHVQRQSLLDVEKRPSFLSNRRGIAPPRSVRMKMRIYGDYFANNSEVGREGPHTKAKACWCASA